MAGNAVTKGGNGKLFDELRAIDDAYALETQRYLQWIGDHGFDLAEGFKPFVAELREHGYSHGGERHTYSASGVNKYVLAIRNRIRYAFKHSAYYQDLGKRMELDEFLKSVPLMKEQRAGLSKSRVLTWKEVSALVKETAGTKIGLVIEFLARSGCRVSEALNIRLADIRPNGAPSFVRITIIGKRSKQREVRVQKELVERIRITFGGTQWLFEHNGKRYNRISISDRIKAASRKKIGKEVSAHALRHSYATEQLARGRSLKAVSEYLGHSSVSTTADIYCHDSLDDHAADLGDSELAAAPAEDADLRQELAEVKAQLAAVLRMVRARGKQGAQPKYEREDDPELAAKLNAALGSMVAKITDSAPSKNAK